MIRLDRDGVREALVLGGRIGMATGTSNKSIKQSPRSVVFLFQCANVPGILTCLGHSFEVSNLEISKWNLFQHL
jgi:hypothetical protein